MPKINNTTVLNTMPILDNISTEILLMIRDIEQRYGHKVSVQTANKYVRLYGKNPDVDNTEKTGMQVMTLATSTSDVATMFETLPTTNAITKISATSTSFTGTFKLVGHKIVSEGVFEEVTQTGTLNGTTEVTLTQPLARAHYLENTGTANWSGGVVRVTQSGITYTSSKPSDVSKVHLQTGSLINNTDEINNVASKAAYTVPDGYYFLVKSVGIGLMYSSASICVSGKLQFAEHNKPFITVLPVSGGVGGGIQHFEYPLVYAKPNSDIRLVGQSSTSADPLMVGYIEGYLAEIIDGEQ